MTDQLEKDVLKIEKNRAEIRDPHPVLKQTMNHLGHQVIAPAANGESRVRAVHRFNSGDRPKALFSDRVVRGENDGSLRAVAVDELIRTVNVDDPSMLD